MDTCVLIDGNSLLYRFYYGLGPMQNSKGMPTSAVYGFTNLLLKIQNDYNPKYLAVAFDLAEPTFRHEKYEAYKAGREAMPEDLYLQLNALQDLLKAMNIAIVTKERYEADDIIGTLAHLMQENNDKVNIVTGDRDSFQLVSPNCSVLYTATRNGSQLVDINEEYIKEKYGITPKELITVKALMGDKSDNIPGIKGIGEKTALKLVSQYPSLDDLYSHLDDLKQSKMKERIIDGKQDAYDSYFLGKIITDVPLNISLKDLEFHGLLNTESQKILQELGFRSILKKLESEDDSEIPKENFQTKSSILVESQRDVIALLSRINANRLYTINYFQDNTPKNDPYHAPDEGGNIYLAIEVDGYYYFVSDQNLVRSFIKGIIEIPNADEILTIGHKFKNLEKIYNRFGSRIVNLSFDIYLASYLNDPSNGQYNLSAIANRWLDLTYPSEDDLLGKGRSRISIEELGESKLRDWLVLGVEIIKKVTPLIKEKIYNDGMQILFNDIEMALAPVLAEMEENGFKIDLKALKELSIFFQTEQDKLEKEIYSYSKEHFNIGSPKQLSSFLFEELGLPVIKKTKTGYSTSAEVLEELKAVHPVIKNILDWRLINKLNSTYGKGLISFVDPATDKIYSTFNQTVTSTGRISSTDPNLQNIPVKTELGREIRKVFIASSPERVLVDADYSQIELRVLAALSEDEHLLNAFINKEDIHKVTASHIFHEKLEDVTSQQRSFAKTINFGLIYGKQAFTLAKDLGITRHEAQEFIDQYFNSYPKILAYLKNSVSSAKEKGYAQTIYGRRRYIDELRSRNQMTVQAGERMAQNMPIQGAAADIIKIAMIDVNQALKKEKLDAKIVLQVHDELIIDSSKKDALRVKEILEEKMSHAADLKVPLDVEAKIGYSWYDAK